MNQRPSRPTKLSRNKAHRLHLERLESRTMLAALALDESVEVQSPRAETRSVAFVAVFRAPFNGDLRTLTSATVLWRPEVVELPLSDTIKLAIESQDTSQSDAFGMMGSLNRFHSATNSGLTIRFGEPVPTIRNPGRQIDTPSFPTSRPDSSVDAILTPARRAASFDRESWMASLSLDGDDEMLFEQWTGTATWSEAYAQANTALNASAVDRIWTIEANNAINNEPSLASEQFQRNTLVEHTSGEALATLDEITNLEDEWLQAKVAVETKSAFTESDNQRPESSASPTLENQQRELTDATRGTSAVIVPTYEEGGLADVAVASSDTRLVQSPQVALLQAVAPEVISTGDNGVTAALDLLPREWSADVAAEVASGEETPTLSTAYLGSFAVVVAASLGVAIQRQRRSPTPEGERQQDRRRQD